MTILNCQQPSVPHILSAVVVIYSSVSSFKVIIKQSCCYFGQQVQQKTEKMARSLPMEFKMYFKVDFETVIRGHHVYKSVWSPVIDQVLECKRDMRAKAQDHYSNAIGVYLISNQKETLAGHIPIELSRLLKNFIEENAENKLCARVIGKRKREVGLVVPAKFSALTAELRIAKILEREPNTRAKKDSHFELKNVLKENKFPFAGLNLK